MDSTWLGSVDPAQTRRRDRDVRQGEGRRELRLQAPGSILLVTAALQAFDQPVQRPHIVRMLGAALDVAAEAEVVAVDLLGFLDMALIQKQGRERVARRMHPGPRLGVGEIIVERDGLAQMPEGLVVLASVKGELAIEQSRADRQGCAGRVAQEPATGRDPLQVAVEPLAFQPGFVETSERRVRHAFRIVLHGRRQHVELGVIRHRFVDDVLPAAEAHQHVRPHGRSSLPPSGSASGGLRCSRPRRVTRLRTLPAARRAGANCPRNMQVNIKR